MLFSWISRVGTVCLLWKVFTASGECHVVLLDLLCGYSVFAKVFTASGNLSCGSLLRQENATLFSWISCVGTVCLLR